LEITLKSGKVLTYEKPNWKKRAEIWDESVQNFNNGLTLSLATCGKMAVYCKVCTEQQLDNDEFTIEDIYDIGGQLLNEVWSTELTKKK